MLDLRISDALGIKLGQLFPHDLCAERLVVEPQSFGGSVRRESGRVGLSGPLSSSQYSTVQLDSQSVAVASES